MAAPQEGYGHPDPYGQQAQYDEQPQTPGFANATSPPPAGDLQDGGKKKKRGYAAQAYDFGGGANSALGGQPVAGGAFSPPLQQPAYGGYPAAAEAQPAYGVQPAYGAPQYGAQPGVPAPAQPAYGQPSPGLGAPAQGYQSFDNGYPNPATGAPAPGVAGITQGMGQMGVGGPGQAPAQQPQAAGVARPMVLNQLYPTDLLNQPFNVAELDLPPPPIILPPNVRYLFHICISNTKSILVKRNSIS
jgi:protein transport protein SEC24